MSTKHLITKDKARQLTSEYRKNRKHILKDEFSNKTILPICETFERAAFDRVLAQEGCVGLRVYFGMNEEMNVNLVIVGVNDRNEDMLTPLSQPAGDVTRMAFASTTTDDDDPIIESGTQCPTNCPPPSELYP
jgi:hypothetical protein